MPILGINTGQLGFLTTLNKELLVKGLDMFFENKYDSVKRSLIKVDIQSEEAENIKFPFALNEISINRKNSSSMLSIKTIINKNLLTTYWSDGLIISTPTGSTGYSLSNGGSLVSPESKVIILNPIAPHNINMRSLIIPDHSEITIKVEGTDNINLSLDSRMYSFDSKNEFKLSKSQFVIKTIKLNNDNFYKRLRDKLFWGQDMRNKKISD